MTSTDDRQQIIDLLHRLAWAIDCRDWATIHATFTPNGTGYGRRGPDAVVATMQDHLGGCGQTQHLLGNHRVEVHGATARSSSYARVYHEGAGPKAGDFFECMGEYDDRWLRTETGWLLSARSFDMRITRGDFSVLRPADPA